MFCVQCGEQNKGRFCGRCGKELEVLPDKHVAPPQDSKRQAPGNERTGWQKQRGRFLGLVTFLVLFPLAVFVLFPLLHVKGNPPLNTQLVLNYVFIPACVAFVGAVLVKQRIDKKPPR